MGSPRHAPGDWRAVETDTGWVIEARDGKGGDYIADVHKHVGASQDDERDRANASVIAASPSMFEALETTLSNINSLSAACPGVRTYDSWRKVVEGALAMARHAEVARG